MDDSDTDFDDLSIATGYQSLTDFIDHDIDDEDDDDGLEEFGLDVLNFARYPLPDYDDNDDDTLDMADDSGNSVVYSSDYDLSDSSEELPAVTDDLPLAERLEIVHEHDIPRYALRNRNRNADLSDSSDESSEPSLITREPEGIEAVFDGDETDFEEASVASTNQAPTPVIELTSSGDSSDEVVYEEAAQVSAAEEADDGSIGVSSPNNSQSRRRPLVDITTDHISVESHKNEDLSPRAKKPKRSQSDEEDDGMTCAICLDSMTNSGRHRIVNLSCGHVFGRSCVERWLKSGCMNGARRCPTCNKRANLRDIRAIYVRKVVALDSTERDKLKAELEQVKLEKAKLELEYTRLKLTCDVQKKENSELDRKMNDLKRQLSNNSLVANPRSQNAVTTCVNMVNKVVVNETGGCRVLTCSIDGSVVVSQKSPTPYFFNYGVCVIRAVDQKPTIFRLDIHNQMVRDMAFNPRASNELLTVSLDRTAKITDLKCNRTVNTFNNGQQLWSCAWDVSNEHRFVTGSQNGIVTAYDCRYANQAVYSYNTPSDMTPVIALASIPHTNNAQMLEGGIVSCRLNAVYVMYNNSASNELLMLEGPYISLNFNQESKCLLFSTRPSSRFPATRHILTELTTLSEGRFLNDKHQFTCGTSGQLMSRSCQTVMSDGDIWVGAHNESKKAVELLSVKLNRPVHSITMPEKILDLCTINVNNSFFVGSLSEKTLYVHKIY